MTGDQGCENMADTLEFSCGKHYGCEPVLSAFSPLGHHSLMTDQSRGTICGDVMFLESEREGPVVPICLGLWNIPVLQHLHGCQTDDKTSSLPLQKKGAQSWLGALESLHLVFAVSEGVYI